VSLPQPHSTPPPLLTSPWLVYADPVPYGDRALNKGHTSPPPTITFSPLIGMSCREPGQANTAAAAFFFRDRYCGLSLLVLPGEIGFGCFYDHAFLFRHPPLPYRAVITALRQVPLFSRTCRPFLVSEIFAFIRALGQVAPISGGEDSANRPLAPPSYASYGPAVATSVRNPHHFRPFLFCPPARRSSFSAAMKSVFLYDFFSVFFAADRPFFCVESRRSPRRVSFRAR